ncbi:hypothetical protein GQ43DRAFT_421287 [Delitschia confertaspora ATCC 74209]|uniref:Uncharacterized protein n=1 Tax=Delitschia confertaspora ATCC 74209 TaxID=1513339 RepID=A0A9P4MN31_9PLEO|nr:hypothetical protein GQ43DRAFT_421287 [Delitschia confertaspora ATCC 74209]
MATNSFDFLEVNENKDVPSLHRSRSGGYTDYLEEREKWERYGRERQMKRYHDQKHAQKGPTSDRLFVPTFESSGNRRVRSQDEIRETSEPTSRAYKVREVKPSFTLDAEAPKTSQLPVRAEWRPAQPSQKKPTVKVEIHQSNIPTNSSRAPFQKTASPRSSANPPELLFQFETLQNKFSEIYTICARNFHVEPANPKDLTFSKIADDLKGYAFNLEVWEHIVNLKNLEQIDKHKRKIVELASRTLDRLLARASGLSDACAKARPRDLKFEELPEDMVDSDEWGKYEKDEEDGIKDITENLGFEIRSHLEGIALQSKTLSRLARALQETTPAAGPEVVAVSRLIKDVDKFFGSAEAIDRYSIDTRFAGKKALDEARHTATSRVGVNY